MLLQFNFENFKSFRERASFDMTAAGISEMPRCVVETGGERVLTASAVFGANGSGKTNVYEAFACMSEFVRNSAQYGENHALFVEKLPKPFLMDEDSCHGDTAFEVYVILPDDPHERTWHYGFSVNPEGIVEEWLNVKAKTARKEKTVFYRSPKETDLSRLPVKGRDALLDLLKKETLVVSLGAGMHIEVCQKIRDWFEGNRLIDSGCRKESVYDSLPEGFLSDQNVRDHVIHYLHSFDRSIQGFQIEKEEVFCLHKMNHANRMVPVPLKEESAGTLKMLEMYQSLVDVLNHGSLLLIDEMDSSLHPLLVRYFVVLFHDGKENPHHAQLIFTTHDTFQLSNFAFRRDEIWFTEKNESGESSLYSLADVVDADGKHIRKDADYEKNYLYGRYGAIPDLDPMNIPVR